MSMQGEGGHPRAPERPPEEASPANTLVSCFQPPELGEINVSS